MHAQETPQTLQEGGRLTLKLQSRLPLLSNKANLHRQTFIAKTRLEVCHLQGGMVHPLKPSNRQRLD